LVTTSFPIESDGSEAAGSFVADLVVALAEHVDVRVVAPGKRMEKETWSDRVEIYRYSAPPFPLSILKPWRPGDLRWIARVLREGAAATRDAAIGASHLFALWGLPCGEWARRAARANGIAYSAWMLGSDVWTLGRVPVLRGMLARVIRHASHAYADGYHLAEDAQRIAGVPVAFLPSTRRIDLVDPAPPREKPPYRVLFLGRWHPNKGVDLLLDALLQLDDADWHNIECIEIQGGGPLEPLVRERVAALQAARRPVQAGRFLAKPDAEAAIVRADWIVIPSRIESIPVVFSDAVKSGRPVVATPVGDLPRLVKDDPACGVLAETVSATAIAGALRATVDSDPTGYSAGVRKQAAEFALPAITQRLLRDFAHG
jgi:glycosyltransferase involved in cell wall biosynthesis